MKPALLVIDMQNDFMEEGGLLEVEGIRDKLNQFRQFIKRIRESNIPVIYTRHCYDPENNLIEAKLFPELKDQGLRKGTPGWEICEELKPKKDEIVIDKNRYDAFFKTDLHQLLQEKDIDTLIITGTMTEVCCESTARTAMFYDYNLLFCSDLTYTSDPKVQKHVQETLGTHFGKVMRADKILKILK